MKFSKYNLVIEDKNVLLIYNTKTLGCVKINNNSDILHFKELSNVPCMTLEDSMVKQLYNHNFVVDDNINEYKQLKEIIDTEYNKHKNDCKIMLYVTEKCNFRCTYCPQKHLAKDFSDENWENLYNYIYQNVIKSNISYLIVDFFGGEPLLKLKKIKEFLIKIDNLAKKYSDFEFVGTMTTNGYLLTPDTYDELTNLNIKFFQITIDGLEDSHNKMRHGINNKKTWQNIIDNLSYINKKNDGTVIKIRTNYNNLNQGSLNIFYKWMNEKFVQNHFIYDLVPVQNYGSNIDASMLGDSNIFNQIELPAYIKRTYNSIKYLDYTCNSANPGYYTISVDGKISKCEVAHSNNVIDIGFLTTNGFEFNSNKEKWPESFETRECADCILYSLCAGRHCPKKKYDKDDRTCVYDKVAMINDLVNKVKSIYNNN